MHRLLSYVCLSVDEASACIIHCRAVSGRRCRMRVISKGDLDSALQAHGTQRSG